jgi:hypothetical protein
MDQSQLQILTQGGVMERRAFLKMTGLLALAGVMPAHAFPALLAPGTAALRVFLMDDCEWIAAPSRAAAIDWYTNERCIKPEDLECEEVDLAGTMTWGEPGDEDAETVTFAESIKRHAESGVTFPETIASTDW